jgi:hypothetical protein
MHTKMMGIGHIYQISGDKGIDGSYPLNCERDLPSPDIKPRLDTNEYSGCDELPDDPAQIDVTGHELTSHVSCRQTYLVRYPLKLTGRTSDAYTVVTVW